MKELIGYIILIIALATPWFWNAYKLTGCDFESGWKCEALHGVGVAIPPAAFVTVWFADDRQKNR